jgi:hypothetical protein
MSNPNSKNISPLVKSVTALDSNFSELERLSAQIEKMDMSSEFDIEKAQPLMNRFAECGQAVSTEIVNLSSQLNEARVRAETAAQIVSTRANEMESRKIAMRKKFEEFYRLAEKVRVLIGNMNELKHAGDKPLSDAERAQLAERLTEFEAQIRPIIEESKQLQKDAQSSKMGALVRQADSLTQSLVASSQKLSAVNQQIVH